MMFQILVYAYLRNIYLYAFKHGIETFIKYNYFHKEQKRSFRNDRFCVVGILRGMDMTGLAYTLLPLSLLAIMT